MQILPGLAPIQKTENIVSFAEMTEKTASARPLKKEMNILKIYQINIHQIRLLVKSTHNLAPFLF